VVTSSRTTIAYLLGARRQSVTRVLGELKRRGLVSSGYGRTVIHDSALDVVVHRAGVLQ
jgi:CRP-like cAMP-binding protein